MEKLKSFDEATAEAKQEMTNTLYQVATMKAHFELLKQTIMNKLELDYLIEIHGAQAEHCKMTVTLRPGTEI